MGNPKQPTNPAQGGRWCGQHNRSECTKNRKKGGDCHNPAISGLDACRMHGGQKGQVLKAKGQAITAWDAMSGDPSVSSSEVVLRVLQMTWLRVNLLSGLLREQFEAEQQARAAAAVSTATAGAPGSASAAGSVDVGPGAGLIGHTVSASPGIGTYVSGEALRGLAKMEADERERTVKFAKAAHDMGIAEKHLALAETFTQELAGLIQRILDGLDLTPQQWQLVAVVVPRELNRGVAGGP